MTDDRRGSPTDEIEPGSRRSFLSGIAVAGLGTTGLSGRLEAASGSEGRDEPLLALSEHDDRIGPTEPLGCGQTVSGELAEDDAHTFHEASGADFPERVPVPHDAYEIDAEAGQHLTFSLSVDRPFWAPLLVLLDTDGEVVTLPTFTSFLDHPTTFRYMAPTTGRYTALVTSHVGEEYFEYALTLFCSDDGD